LSEKGVHVGKKNALAALAETPQTVFGQVTAPRDSFPRRCVSAVKAVLPAPLKRWVREELRRYRMRPPLGWVRFGTLRRLTPISPIFGLDRGQAIDRYYIDRFLRNHSGDIQGHVLEIGEPFYTRQFGGNRVTRSDVLHPVSGNPNATLVGDLVTGQGVPRETFDCMILTQVFPFIYEVRAAIATVFAALKPGGVLLATVSGISQISRYDMERWGDYWRFTTMSSHRLFSEFWPSEGLRVEAYGNVLVAMAHLYGLSSVELKAPELEYHDPDYQVLITVRAVKPHGAKAVTPKI
jgi:hypothetical protein